MSCLLVQLLSSLALLFAGCHGYGYDLSVRGRVLCPDGRVPWGPDGDEVSCPGWKRREGRCRLAYVKLCEADGTLDPDDLPLGTRIASHLDSESAEGGGRFWLQGWVGDGIFGGAPEPFLVVCGNCYFPKGTPRKDFDRLWSKETNWKCMSLDLSAAAGRVNGKGLREIGGLEIVLGVARKLRQVKESVGIGIGTRPEGSRALARTVTTGTQISSHLDSPSAEGGGRFWVEGWAGDGPLGGEPEPYLLICGNCYFPTGTPRKYFERLWSKESNWRCMTLDLKEAGVGRVSGKGRREIGGLEIVLTGSNPGIVSK
ncbi:hypothetical protein AAVH_32654 [Aphelenchoides avenae]|nr:hypothetical protein AAVH_32654 [Aphelenchus avenae]